MAPLLPRAPVVVVVAHSGMADPKVASGTTSHVFGLLVRS